LRRLFSSAPRMPSYCESPFHRSNGKQRQNRDDQTATAPTTWTNCCAGPKSTSPTSAISMANMRFETSCRCRGAVGGNGQPISMRPTIRYKSMSLALGRRRFVPAFAGRS
jgi:hypothetical protein